MFNFLHSFQLEHMIDYASDLSFGHLEIQPSFSSYYASPSYEFRSLYCYMT